MNYLNNSEVPAILISQYRQGLLSLDEFNRLAQEALGELEVLRSNYDDAMAEELHQVA